MFKINIVKIFHKNIIRFLEVINKSLNKKKILRSETTFVFSVIMYTRIDLSQCNVLSQILTIGDLRKKYFKLYKFKNTKMILYVYMVTDKEIYVITY